MAKNAIGIREKGSLKANKPWFIGKERELLCIIFRLWERIRNAIVGIRVSRRVQKILLGYDFFAFQFFRDVCGGPSLRHGKENFRCAAADKILSDCRDVHVRKKCVLDGLEARRIALKRNVYDKRPF